MDNVLVHKSRETQQAFEYVGRIHFCLSSYSSFSMMQNGYMDTSKAMSNRVISKIIEH